MEIKVKKYKYEIYHYVGQLEMLYLTDAVHYYNNTVLFVDSNENEVYLCGHFAIIKKDALKNLPKLPF